MSTIRRSLPVLRAWGLAATLLAAPVAAILAAHADERRLYTVIVPYPAGGLGDILPRAMAEVLRQQTGDTFIVDNRPGATQMIGTRAAAHAKPDGSTILFGSVTSLAINPSLKRHLDYDPVKDFEPVSLTYVTPMYIVTRPDLPVNSLQDLIALARREPGKLTYASGGVGSSSHLAGELLKTMTGIDITHVPYAGTGPAVRDVIGSHVDMTITGSGMSYANEGAVKVLAVTGAKRSPEAPEVPTVAESGVPGYEATIWFGFLVPAGTPPEAVNDLSKQMREAAASQELHDKLQATGNEIEIVGSTPKEFADFIGKEIPRWRSVIEAAHLEQE